MADADHLPRVVATSFDEVRAVGERLKRAIRERRAGDDLAFLSADADRSRAIAALGEDGVRTLEDSGILRSSGGVTTAILRCHLIDGSLIFTDPPQEGDAFAPDEIDALYEAPRLGRYLVRTPVASAIDIGTGSGVLAIAIASFAKRVLATDVNPRALSVAAFNAALNGIRNVEFRLADLFGEEPARWDSVTWNTPVGWKYAYTAGGAEQGDLASVGGADEDLLLRLLAAVPERLASAGTCQLNIAGIDRPGSRLVDRVASALGDAFQILFLRTACVPMPDGNVWVSGWTTIRRAPPGLAAARRVVVLGRRSLSPVPYVCPVPWMPYHEWFEPIDDILPTSMLSELMKRMLDDPPAG